jgi:hypothetical protein
LYIEKTKLALKSNNSGIIDKNSRTFLQMASTNMHSSEKCFELVHYLKKQPKFQRASKEVGPFLIERDQKFKLAKKFWFNSSGNQPDFLKYQKKLTYFREEWTKKLDGQEKFGLFREMRA